jgi:proline iminopeptidase
MYEWHRLHEWPYTVTAWELSRAWPGSRLVIVEQEGHDSTGSGMANAIVRATDEFA